MTSVSFASFNDDISAVLRRHHMRYCSTHGLQTSHDSTQCNAKSDSHQATAGFTFSRGTIILPPTAPAAGGRRRTGSRSGRGSGKG